MPALRDSLSLAARDFALALHRFTRLQGRGPHVPASAIADSDNLRASARHLPGVGWVIGMAACLVFALVSLALRGNAWAPAVAAVFCTVATVLLTGGQHEGALARMADRLEARLPGAVAQQSYGVLALGLLLAAKITLLAAVASASEGGVMAALFAGHVVSRFAPLLVAHWAGSGEVVDRRSLGVAALWCAPPLLLLLAAGDVAFLLLPLLVAALACYGMLRLARNTWRGPSEDDWGAVQQACEVAFYFGAAMAAG